MIERTLCLCRRTVIKRARAQFDDNEDMKDANFQWLTGCLYPENLYHQILGLITYLHHREDHF